MPSTIQKSLALEQPDQLEENRTRIRDLKTLQDALSDSAVVAVAIDKDVTENLSTIHVSGCHFSKEKARNSLQQVSEIVSETLDVVKDYSLESEHPRRRQSDGLNSGNKRPKTSCAELNGTLVRLVSKMKLQSQSESQPELTLVGNEMDSIIAEMERLHLSILADIDYTVDMDEVVRIGYGNTVNCRKFLRKFTGREDLPEEPEHMLNLLKHMLDDKSRPEAAIDSRTHVKQSRRVIK